MKKIIPLVACIISLSASASAFASYQEQCAKGATITQISTGTLADENGVVKDNVLRVSYSDSTSEVASGLIHADYTSYSLDKLQGSALLSQLQMAFINKKKVNIYDHKADAQGEYCNNFDEVYVF